MRAASTPGLRDEPREHVIGRFVGSEPGPLVLCVGGLHGNEPSGVDALDRVFGELSEARMPFRGEAVGLAGNLVALADGRRFVDEDLNRIWSLDRIAALRRLSENGASPPDAVEAREQSHLLALLESELRGAEDREVYFLDLHTTSSDSVPFLTFSDSLRNRSFAGSFPLPLVLGVEEEVEGTLLDFVDHMGHVAVCAEGGSHMDPSSVDHLEAVVWLTLVSTGCVRLDDVPEAGGLRERLSRAVGGVPQVFEVRYRHGLRPGDDFRMKPGFRNFQEVEEGELLARDDRGEIGAPMSGRLFLPLYQEQGEEGFFLVREVAPFWLKVSAVLRRLRVDRLARFLPGIRPHPDREETLVVHPGVANRFLVGVFHLLGYRRERPEDGRLVLSRRKDAVEGG
jgi:succinylglutamate desuccinylase